MTNNRENWRNIKDYNGLYQISDFGNIKSVSLNKILKCRKAKNGYLYTVFSVNCVRKTVKPHRLVAENFILNIKNLPTVNHKDGNKINNHVTNLEWVSYGDNQKHAYKLGLQKINPFKASKLSINQIKDIKKELKNYKWGLIGRLASKYNVCRETISHINRNISWRSL